MLGSRSRLTANGRIVRCVCLFGPTAPTPVSLDNQRSTVFGSTSNGTAVGEIPESV
jgi:hypothetical protein